VGAGISQIDKNTAVAAIKARINKNIKLDKFFILKNALYPF